MRRRRYYNRPEISYIPKNKKLIDRASEIFAVLKKGPNTALSTELADISTKLRLSNVITERQVYDFNDGWNKQTLPTLTVFVRKLEDGVCICKIPLENKIELIDFENEYPFADNELGCISLAPDAKNSDVFFRDAFYRIFHKGPCEDVTIRDLLLNANSDSIQL